MTAFPYALTGPIGGKAMLGLLVLQTDETVEQDFRRLFADPEVALYVSRVGSGAEVTPDSLTAMKADLPRAAALLPPPVSFDVIGYGCTSGTTMIGADRVAALVREGARTRAVTDPLTAALAGLAALGARRIGLVSPYIESVAGPIRDAFQAQGIEVPATVSFGEESEERVARIDPRSIHAAALEVGRTPGLDAVFLSCTNLRTLDVIAPLEAELGLPVLSSNQALAWHMHRLAGLAPGRDAPGRLFAV